MPDFANWVAWIDHLPRSQPTLHVQGDGSFPQPGFTVELRQPLAPAATMPAPVVRGPALAVRGGAPPSFDADPGPGRFFALEVTTDPALFAKGSNPSAWPPDKTYASWKDGNLLPKGQVTLPQADWQELQAADCLFYRIVTSGASDAWTGVVRSAGPDGKDPFLVAVDSSDGLNAPDVLLLACLIAPPAGSPPPNPTVVHATYSQTPPPNVKTVTIVSPRMSLEIDNVF